MVQTGDKKPADKAGQDGKAAESKPAEEPKPFSTPDALQGIVSLLEKSVKTKDTRLLMGRLLRQTAQVRKHLTGAHLAAFIKSNVPESAPAHAYLLAATQQVDDAAPMEEDAKPAVASKAPAAPSSLPEVELFAHLLTIMFLLDHQQFEQARQLAATSVQRLRDFNRRTLDVIAARIYFYLSWAHENAGSLADIRSELMAAHKTAVLRHDAIGQETLLNLLLRSYLHYNLYDQAEKFRSKAQKADTFRSPQQYCRYLYYLGRIRAIQLEYSEAKDCLQQASRKAPTSAVGFRIASTKWLVLVRLLLGEVPERIEFEAPDMRVALAPYFELTNAVRGGDLAAFTDVAARYAEVFRADATSNLITRLHHNVIRTGLRRIHLAYSRISLKDVAEKLALPSAEDAEFIVAKAIRDGGIDAVIDHAGGFLRSREVLDVYSTQEPQSAFHARIAFCLDVHNEAIKAMRFEPGAHKVALETAEERKDRLAQEAELAKAIAEDDEEDGI